MKQALIAFSGIFLATSAVAQHEGHGTPSQPAAVHAESRTESAYGNHRAWQDPQQRPWREANAAVAASGHQHGATPPAGTPQAAAGGASHDHGDMKAHREKMKAGMKGDMKAHHEAMHKRMQSMHGGAPGATPAPSQPGKSGDAHKH